MPHLPFIIALIATFLAVGARIGRRHPVALGGFGLLAGAALLLVTSHLTV